MIQALPTKRAQAKVRKIVDNVIDLGFTLRKRLNLKQHGVQAGAGQNGGSNNEY
jgi:hypothetical protein